MNDIDTYAREHAVKVCREKCIEEGLWGAQLEVCIRECVEEIRGIKYATRKN